MEDREERSGASKMKRPALEEVFFPPFEGFPEEGLSFLRRLKRNNNRPWFQLHKSEYEETVKFPMQCLIAGLAARMSGEAPEFVFDPKRSLFRIYRDVRFSRNKAPYKTNVAAAFGARGKQAGKEDSPGFYLGIEPGEVLIGGGIYMPWGEQLKRIRHSIADRPSEFLDVVRAPRFRKIFGEIIGDKLTKAPLGFPKEHPMIGYLRYKQFFVGIEVDEKKCHSPRFQETVAGVFADALPFLRWLVGSLR